MWAKSTRSGLPSVKITNLTRPVSKHCTTARATPFSNPTWPTMSKVSLPVPVNMVKNLSFVPRCSGGTSVLANSVLAACK